MQAHPTVQALFTPVKLGRYVLPHRIAMAPMTRCRSDDRSCVTPLMARYYAQRANPATGASLIISEGTQISSEGVGYVRTPGCYLREHGVAWARAVQAAHEQGGIIFAQLWHVGRISHPSWHDGQLPVSASPIAPPRPVWTREGVKAPAVAPRALELDEIPRLIADYVHAARIAIDAGFDGIELHAANSYLIDQFLRDGSNQRSDAYGGLIEHRTRLLQEVSEALAHAVGPDKVGVRLSPSNDGATMIDSDPLALFVRAAEKLAPIGLAYLHVLEGLQGSLLDASDGPDAKRTRIALPMRRAFKGCFMLNEGLTPASATRVIEQSEADVVAFGIPFISNPDLASRIRRFGVDAPLAEADRATFYTDGAKGYVDYPALAQ
jgi:N-ethylmaleimide reductase